MKNLKKILALVLSFAMILTMMQITSIFSAEDSTENVATVYVSTEGSDASGDGTQGNPYASLSKAMEVIEADTTATEGKIIITSDNGGSGISFTSAEHTKMIAIEGIDEAITINGNNRETWRQTKGPLTLKNISVTNLGLEPFGYELNVEESVNLITRLNVRAGYNTTNGDKIYLDAHKHTSYNADVYLYIGKGTVNGDLDLYVNNIYANSVDLQAATYNGNVNLTVNNYTKSTNGGYDLYVKNSGVNISGALQVILNNGVTTSYWKDFRKTQAQGGTWLISSELASDGSIIETTDKTGVFKVKGDLLATAYKCAADGSVTGENVTSVEGVLDLSGAPGEYLVKYTEYIFEEDTNPTYYVSTKGSDDTGNGRYTTPYRTIAKAMETIEANSVAVTAKIVVLDDDNGAGADAGMAFTSAAHTKMITIEGKEDSIVIDGGSIDNQHYTNGPLTLNKVTIKNLRLTPQGNKLVYAEGLILDSESTQAIQTGFAGEVAGEDIYINAKYNSCMNLYIGRDENYVANGDINVYVDRINAHYFDIHKGTYKGNVNLTLNGYEACSDSSSTPLWISPDAKLEGNLQILLNNGIKAIDKASFRANAPADKTWILYGDKADDDSFLEITDTVGIYKVKGEMLATAYKINTADESVSQTGIESVNGVLDLSNAPGEYSVEYRYNLTEEQRKNPTVYVSAKGSDDAGRGTALRPYLTLSKAMEVIEANAEAITGKIIISDDDNGAGISFESVAHTKMITIEGIENSIVLDGVNSENYRPTNGPLTLDNITIKNLGLNPRGHKLVIEDGVIQGFATKSNLHIKTAYAGTVPGEDIYINTNNRATDGKTMYITLGKDANYVADGDVNLYVNKTCARAIDIEKGTYKGNVNITVNNYSAYDSQDPIWINSTANIQGSLQIILNNGITAIDKEKFRERAPLDRTWILYGPENPDGAILEMTDTVGVYKVKGDTIAKAYKVDITDDSVSETAISSVDGILDLSSAPGEYVVKYKKDVPYGDKNNPIVYVSTKGSDTTGDGTWETPYLSLSKAMEVIEANADAVSGKIIISNDANGEGVEDGIQFTSAAHTKMITIEGVDDSIVIDGIKSSTYHSINGPLTLDNVTIKRLGLRPFGHKLALEDGVIQSDVSEDAKFHYIYTGMENTTVPSEDIYINTNKKVHDADRLYIIIGKKSGYIVEGDVNLYVNKTYAHAIDIENKGVFKGNVNLTINNYGGKSDRDDIYLRKGTDIRGALQVILNNGITKIDKAGFRANAPLDRTWILYGEAATDGTILETTGTVGVYKVVGNMIANAYKINITDDTVSEDAITSKDGLLDLSSAPGEYVVKYEKNVINAIYIDAMNSQNETVGQKVHLVNGKTYNFTFDYRNIENGIGNNVNVAVYSGNNILYSSALTGNKNIELVSESSTFNNRVYKFTFNGTTGDYGVGFVINGSTIARIFNPKLVDITNQDSNLYQNATVRRDLVGWEVSTKSATKGDKELSVIKKEDNFAKIKIGDYYYSDYKKADDDAKALYLKSDGEFSIGTNVELKRGKIYRLAIEYKEVNTDFFYDSYVVVRDAYGTNSTNEILMSKFNNDCSLPRLDNDQYFYRVTYEFSVNEDGTYGIGIRAHDTQSNNHLYKDFELNIGNVVLFDMNDPYVNIMSNSNFSDNLNGWYVSEHVEVPDDTGHKITASTDIQLDAGATNYGNYDTDGDTIKLVSLDKDFFKKKTGDEVGPKKMVYVQNGSTYHTFFTHFAYEEALQVGHTYICTFAISSDYDFNLCVRHAGSRYDIYDPIQPTEKVEVTGDGYKYKIVTFEFSIPEMDIDGREITDEIFVGINMAPSQTCWLFDFNLYDKADPRKINLVRNPEFRNHLDYWIFGWTGWFEPIKLGYGWDFWPLPDQVDETSKFYLADYDFTNLISYKDDSGMNDGEWWNPDDVVNIDAQPEVGTVLGTIIDDKGNPLNVTVELVSTTDESIVFKGKTNAKGYFEINKVIADMYKVFLIGADGTRRDTDTYVSIIDGSIVTVDMKVAPLEIQTSVDTQIVGSTIKGTLYNAKREPLAGVTVGVALNKTMVTDENGNFEFTGLPAGTYKLFAVNPDGSYYLLRTYDLADGQIASLKLKYDPEADKSGANGNDSANDSDNSDASNNANSDNESGFPLLIIIVVGGVLVVGAGTAALLIFLKKKKSA